jgi:hypothetical protein
MYLLYIFIYFKTLDCELRLEVASKCKSKHEYYTKYISAYEISIKSDEIDIFTIKFNWIGKKRNGYWKMYGIKPYYIKYNPNVNFYLLFEDKKYSKEF